MRQAGRYMAEYRTIRRDTSFLDLCKNPDLCAEVMLTAVERLKVDAAILFSDLLLILEPMGIQLRFSPSGGPVIDNPIRSPADVDRLLEIDDAQALGYVMEAVRKTRAGLADILPLIGFAGAPFTLAAYIIEGGSSRDYRLTKNFMYCDPGAWNALLGRLSRSIGLYLNAQITSGVQLVQVFDSWAGCLGVDDYCRCVMPHTQSVVAALPPEVPVILFSTGNPALLPCVKKAAGNRKNLVMGVDWRIRLDDAWQTIGHDTAIQGNLDPAILLSTPAEIRRQVKAILNQAAGRPGHIFNLGHGVLPQTPVENAIALVDVVHELSCK
jgi:uroporphyrinogen decarboxylase